MPPFASTTTSRTGSPSEEYAFALPPRKALHEDISSSYINIQNEEDETYCSSASASSESSCSLQSQTSSSKKSVRLDLSLNQVRVHTNRTDMTSPEMAAAWYSPAEFAAMKDDCVRILQQLNANPDYARMCVDNDFQTARGLLQYTQAMHVDRERRKNRLRQSVLAEQVRQRYASSLENEDCFLSAVVYDFETMAAVAAYCSAGTLEAAYARAHQDTVDAYGPQSQPAQAQAQQLQAQKPQYVMEYEPADDYNSDEDYECEDEQDSCCFSQQEKDEEQHDFLEDEEMMEDIEMDDDEDELLLQESKQTLRPILALCCGDLLKTLKQWA